MKLIKGIIIVVLLIFGVTGCGKPDDDVIKVKQTFTGESSHWKVSCKINGYVEFYKKEGKLLNKSDGVNNLVLEYTGNIKELEDLRNIKIDYLMGSSEFNFSEAQENLKYEFNSSVNAVAIIEISQSKQFEITVTWDGLNGGTENIVVE